MPDCLKRSYLLRPPFSRLLFFHRKQGCDGSLACLWQLVSVSQEREICTDGLLNMNAAIVLFAHQPFRRVFRDKTALISGPPHAPFRF
jgi:hypothetical protein